MSKGVALITGAGARLGGALAIALGERGYSVAVHYGRNATGAAEVVAKIERAGSRAVAMQADLTDVETPGRLKERVLREFGGLDLLVNNASYWAAPEQINGEAGLLKESVEEWERTIATDLRAPFFLMQAFAPLLERAKDGVIVNVLDRSVSRPFLNRVSHSIAKGALANATTIAAETLKGRVRVNGLEFGDLLAPEAMPEAVRSTRAWGGVEVYIAAVWAIVEDRSKHGAIERV